MQQASRDVHVAGQHASLRASLLPPQPQPNHHRTWHLLPAFALPQGLDRRFQLQGEEVPPFFQYMRSKLVSGGSQEVVFPRLGANWRAAAAR